MGTHTPPFTEAISTYWLHGNSCDNCYGLLVILGHLVTEWKNSFASPILRICPSTRRVLPGCFALFYANFNGFLIKKPCMLVYISYYKYWMLYQQYVNVWNEMRARWDVLEWESRGGSRAGRRSGALMQSWILGEHNCFCHFHSITC